MRIAHISDSHFGTTTPEKVVALTSILRKLNPTFVALSGDITQRAHRTQFLAARKFCEDLAPLRVITVPGNHDIPLFDLPARLIHPYKGFTETFGSVTSQRLCFERVEILGIDSTHPSRHTQGDFRVREFRTLHEFSDQSDFRIAMFHHPLDCPKYVDEKNLLKGRKAAARGLSQARVDLVLGGHIHDPYVVTTHDRYPEIENPFVISVAGTCLSSRTRAKAPNSFTTFDVDLTAPTALLTSTRYDLLDGAEFHPVQTVEFQRIPEKNWILSQ